MKENGLGLLVSGERPRLNGKAAIASKAWNWLGGWYPERLPVYLALYPCDDVHGLVARLVVLRDACAAVTEGNEINGQPTNHS